MNEQQTELRVSNLELFFDLVFVFTITQLTALVENSSSFIGVAKALLIFVVMFWMYAGYAWLTNQVPPRSTSRRLLIVGGMAAFLTCALAIPRAFDESALAFAVGYALVVLVHSGLYAQVYRSAVWRFVPMNLAGVGFLMGAAFVEGWERYALWSGTLVLHLVASALASRVGESQSSGYHVHAGHFVERHGLLLIIAFGESVVAIGIALSRVKLVPAVYVAAVLGLVLVATLWWSYFMADQELSEEILTAAPLKRRVRLALHGYFYAYMPILFGIVVLSAGLGHAVENITEHLPVKYAVLLGGGAALFLIGTAVFRLIFGIRPVGIRFAAAAAAVAAIPAGILISGLAQTGFLLGVMVVMIAIERRRVRKLAKPEQEPQK